MSLASEPIITAKPAGFLTRSFQPFRYRDFRLMWGGAFTSTCGTWMQNVAQSWLVLELTGSAFYLGLVGFLSDLPIMLFSLVGGVVADRVDRRKLLLGSQYTQMASAFILTGLVIADKVQIWHILVLVFLSGTGQSFGGPAYQALIPGMVPREDVPKAIALNSIQFNLARTVGPLLAAAAMAAGGLVLCFGLNGISFLAVIISLYIIRATFLPAKTTESVYEGLKQGFAYVKSRGALWQLTVLGFVSTFCGIPLLTLLPVFAKDIFGLGATGFSYLVATSGAGSITGALLYAGLSHNRHRPVLVLWTQIVFALLLSGFAVSRNLPLSHLILFLAGMGLMTMFASITSLVQLGTSEELRGRTMSIFMLAFRSGMPLGNLLFGYLAEQFSPTAALIVASILLAIVATGFLASNSNMKRL
ncbi:MAG: MFS transporter [Acidobacteria bacterium]|nr:MFS transporter [Acidobacteriota bacterium]